MRAKSRWSKPGKAHTPEAIASVLNAVAWNAATRSVLEMENGGLQADTQLQRLTVIEEFMAFLVHVADRLTATRMDVDERGRFINAFGVRAAELMAGNLADLQGPGDYRASFIDTLNERMSEYAEFGFSEASGPDIGFLRGFGQHVAAAMGPRDQRWILEHVMEVAAPEATETLTKTMRNLFV
ncbi:MAG TPA: hypothetical protein ENG84_07010 [Gammaproteobacteria bacterium]|nr:hypothetical protein [Gammaproteobacteria bacterium]